MARPKIWFIIVMLIVAAIGVISILTRTPSVPTSHVNAQLHIPELRNSKIGSKLGDSEGLLNKR